MNNILNIATSIHPMPDWMVDSLSSFGFETAVDKKGLRKNGAYGYRLVIRGEQIPLAVEMVHKKSKKPDKGKVHIWTLPFPIPEFIKTNISVEEYPYGKGRNTSTYFKTDPDFAPMGDINSSSAVINWTVDIESLKKDIFDSYINSYISFIREHDLLTSPSDESDVIINKTDSDFFLEGGKKEITATIFDRNRKLRELVAQRDSYTCQVCGINLGNVYGEDIGGKYIEVHHINPLADASGEHEGNEKNLVSLCPNCHRMIHALHRTGMPADSLLDELKKRIARNLDK